MLIRHISVSLLIILVLISTGGIHYIFHHCLNTGESQVHFTSLHGCCSDGDDHCTTGVCSADCCHSAHHNSSSTWQEECCIDDIHFFKTDVTDQTRGLHISLQMAGFTTIFAIAEAEAWIPRQANCRPSQGSTSPPDAPLRHLLCTYRT
ncbi:MAG: hypothetical protein CVU06_10445 [Bacteroidetes bacterium HGW-Bacteroidetes-22]|nr:MAG: hypothetical protein CVU06_10445 [Bacteroidetes bacterium HGW-Bacteroidetes-22]